MTPRFRRARGSGERDGLGVPVLLHIGIPKSATTALQNSLAGAREALARQGILYPDLDGRVNHHRLAVQLLGRRHSLWNPDGKRHDQLDALRDAASARHVREVVLSSELMSETVIGGAWKLVEPFGSQVRVLITLRSIPELLPSSWQQGASTGEQLPYEEWLRRVLRDPERLDLRPLKSLRGDDGLDLITRWSSLVGARNVIVLIPDPADRTSVFVEAEHMLGLAADTLPRLTSNPSLSFAQSEFTRLTGAALRTVLSRRERIELIQLGMGNGMKAGGTEVGSRATLPDWAAQAAQRAGEALAARIATSGARVAGDLTALGAVPSTLTGSLPSSPHHLPRAVVADALGGLYDRGITPPFAHDGMLHPLRVPKPVDASVAPSGQVCLAALVARGRTGLVAAARESSSRLAKAGVAVNGTRPDARARLGMVPSLLRDDPLVGGDLILTVEPAAVSLRRAYQAHLLGGGTEAWDEFLAALPWAEDLERAPWEHAAATLAGLLDASGAEPRVVSVDDAASLAAGALTVERALGVAPGTVGSVAATHPRAALLSPTDLALLREVNVRQPAGATAADRGRLVVRGMVAAMIADPGPQPHALQLPATVQSDANRFDDTVRATLEQAGLPAPAFANAADAVAHDATVVEMEHAVRVAAGMATLAHRAFVRHRGESD